MQAIVSHVMFMVTSLQQTKLREVFVLECVIVPIS